MKVFLLSDDQGTTELDAVSWTENLAMNRAGVCPRFSGQFLTHWRGFA